MTNKGQATAKAKSNRRSFNFAQDDEVFWWMGSVCDIGG